VNSSNRNPNFNSNALISDDSRQLRGVLERIMFSNHENHYCVGEFSLDQTPPKTVTIAGNLPGVQCGETLLLKGTWSQHPQYGPQFKIETWEARLPASMHGLKKYLGSGLIPGIGKTYAAKLVEAFGLKTLEVITADSGRLLEVPGIGPQRAKSIKKAWDDQRAVREVMLFLQTYGVGQALCLKLVRKYGVEAKTILETQPYKVVQEVPGIGFKTADRIALNLGIASDGPARIEAGILYTLEEASGQGHTGVPPEALVVKTTELLEVPGKKVEDALHTLLERKELLIPPEAGGLVQTLKAARAENQCVQSLMRLQRAMSGLPSIQIQKAIEWTCERAQIDFAPEQKQALEKALTHKVAIVTGGPGTGKTTLLKALVSILSAKKVRIVLAAPTGRASQRMSETTGLTAQTIHRLLQFNPEVGGFNFNEEKPLTGDFFIIDEASMLDSQLSAAFLRAIPVAAHVLLVGDSDQLPSVGPGNVLADLITSGQIPFVRLGRVFRQSERSPIVTVAHNILAGKVDGIKTVRHVKDIDPKEDVHFIEALEGSDAAEKIIELCSDALVRWYGKEMGHKGVQVLTPMHRGLAGTMNLNTQLQQVLNGQGEQLPGSPFKLADKVIQTRNVYDKNVFNGDLGLVTELERENGSIWVDFSREVIPFERMEQSDLQLAYAMSIHKSQGSEFPIVIIPLLKEHFMMLQRNLVYTGLTRARKKVFFVGDPSAYSMAVRRVQASTRQTGLLSRLQKLIS
jgi:exodeoxyribonuclease V alpha subunit